MYLTIHIIGFDFLNWEIRSKTCWIICLARSVLFPVNFNCGIMLRMWPASIMKYSKSLSLQRLVSWDSRFFSELNSASRSYNSNGGGGNVRNSGGKTATYQLMFATFLEVFLINTFENNNKLVIPATEFRTAVEWVLRSRAWHRLADMTPTPSAPN